jgi:hypothetical protein
MKFTITSEPVSLSLPASTIARLQRVADERGVTLQALIRSTLAELTAPVTPMTSDKQGTEASEERYGFSSVHGKTPKEFAEHYGGVWRGKGIVNAQDHARRLREQAQQPRYSL